MPSLTVAVLLTLAVAGCGARNALSLGSTSSGASGTSGSSGGAGSAEVAGIGTVLAKDGGPPQLCLGAIALSLPPQCSGPEIVGWDWDAAPASESMSGVRWGAYAVVGRWDGTRFTMTRPPTTPETFRGKPPAAPGPMDFTTPCAAPEGGWRVVDPALATQEAFDRTVEAASSIPGFGGLWIDQPSAAADGTGSNDPTVFILNVKVTKDPAGAEATLRRTWGGKLCVSSAGATETELTRIQDEVTRATAILTSGTDVIAGRVDVEVLHDDGTLQRALDAKYGAGVIRVTSALFPYEPR